MVGSIGARRAALAAALALAARAPLAAAQGAAPARSAAPDTASQDAASQDASADTAPQATAASADPAPQDTAASVDAAPHDAAASANRAPDDPLRRAASADPATRVAAAARLAGDPRPAALSLLVVMLQRDVDARVRAAAARALGGVRSPALAPLLELAARSDRDAGVRATAREAYERLWPLGKSPRAAAGLSLLCPGCGQLYLRRPALAATYLGTTAALIGGGLALLYDHGAAPALGDPTDPELDRDDPIGLQLLLAGQNLWFYGAFAAYRDARRLRGDDGYARAITHEGLAELASAPLRPSVLRRPWVWLGVPLAVGAGVALTALVSPDELGRDRRSLFDGRGVNFLGRRFATAPGLALGVGYDAALFLPVGVGEEALFRGVMQAELSESLGVWGGWATASLLFGAVHVFNFVGTEGGLAEAAVAVPYITLVGSMLGLAYVRTGARLETSVAMHAWYDFLLSTVAFVADPDHQPFVARLALPF